MRCAASAGGLLPARDRVVLRPCGGAPDRCPARCSLWKRRARPRRGRPG